MTRKSQAIEGIMQIVLMVAVIIVGMSFLMKAFGIDILGWLKEKFEGFGVPDSGKALHIKADASSDRAIWEFHLINEREAKQHRSEQYGVGWTSSDMYFYPGDTLPRDKCAIYVTQELSRVPDEGAYYFANPGDIIQDDDCTSPFTCISYINGRGGFCETRQVINEDGDKCVQGRDATCENKDGYMGLCAGKFHYTNCAGGGGSSTIHEKCLKNDNVLGLEFDSGMNIADNCAKDNPHECNLLEKPLATKEGWFGYKVKYGLICDQNGIWQVCKPDREEDTPSGISDCTCRQSDDVFIWKGEGCGKAISEQVIQNGDTVFLTGRVSNGGEIPLSGYSENECKWTVSIATTTTSQYSGDKFRGVTALADDRENVQCFYYDDTTKHDATCNYLMMCTKQDDSKAHVGVKVNEGADSITHNNNIPLLDEFADKGNCARMTTIREAPGKDGMTKYRGVGAYNTDPITCQYYDDDTPIREQDYDENPYARCNYVSLCRNPSGDKGGLYGMKSGTVNNGGIIPQPSEFENKKDQCVYFIGYGQEIESSQEYKKYHGITAEVYKDPDGNYKAKCLYYDSNSIRNARCNYIVVCNTEEIQ